MIRSYFLLEKLYPVNLKKKYAKSYTILALIIMLQRNVEFLLKPRLGNVINRS